MDLNVIQSFFFVKIVTLRMINRNSVYLNVVKHFKECIFIYGTQKTSWTLFENGSYIRVNTKFFLTYRRKKPLDSPDWLIWFSNIYSLRSIFLKINHYSFFWFPMKEEVYAVAHVKFQVNRFSIETRIRIPA